MLTLLSLLSGTIIYTTCSNIGNFMPYGYYIAGEYNVYRCDNNNNEAVIIHELGHLFGYMYRGDLSEEYANKFTQCWYLSLCRNKMLKKISEIKNR